MLVPVRDDAVDPSPLPPAPQVDDDASTKRDRIARMYAAARAEAFADVDEIEVEELEDLEEREAVLFVDCREDRSGVYAETLAERGFRARNLVGGVLAWAHAGRSFVDEDGNPVRRVHVYGAEWDLLPESYEGVHEGKPAP